MKTSGPYLIKPISENMLTISVGDSIDPQINKSVFQLYSQLLKNRHASWLDIIPAYSTVSIIYDVLSIRQQHASAFAWMKDQLENVMNEISEDKTISSRHLHVPACYDAEFALDADRIEKEKRISLDDLISLHASKTYRVFMIGFLPGFAYMGTVDQRLAAPRLATPRTHVPAGSVGIAGEQTGIYPLDSPGGWNIIGRTPLKIFNPAATPSVLFQPGDQVKFIPIARAEFESFDQSSYKVIVHGH